MDKKLNTALPLTPQFIYRKAPSFGDRAIKKVIDPPTRPQSFWDRNDFFACRRCKACGEVTRSIRGLDNFISTSNNRSFDIKQFITCNSTYVVYALKYPCGLIYVGRTKRMLRVRIAEHIHNIKMGFKDHNVSLHFKLKHNQDAAGLEFWGVEHLEPHWRGLNLFRELSKRETQWIYLIDVRSPKGLNIELNIVLSATLSTFFQTIILNQYF